MAISDSQKKALAKYVATNYDNIKFRVKKGERQTIKDHAAARGESLNGFIVRSIRETIERDNS